MSSRSEGKTSYRLFAAHLVSRDRDLERLAPAISRKGALAAVTPAGARRAVELQKQGGCLQFGQALGIKD
jgi:hypothetical protein